MKCKCQSDRIARIMAKSSDLNCVRLKGEELDGYLPADMGIGSGDYIEFDWCLECGQIQGGFWPLPECELEVQAKEREAEFDDIGSLD